MWLEETKAEVKEFAEAHPDLHERVVAVLEPHRDDLVPAYGYAFEFGWLFYFLAAEGSQA